MAKQTGPTFITGTYNDLCFYKWGDGYFLRKKSSLTADKVKKSAAFANSRKSANDLGTAAVLASQVYRTLPKDRRNVTLYRKMTGAAKLMLKEGKTKNEVLQVLSGNLHVQMPVQERAPVKEEIVTSTPPRLNVAMPLEDYPRYFQISTRSIRELNPRKDRIIEGLKELLPFRKQRRVYLLKC